MEKLQQDSANLSLEQHKQDLIGALEAEKTAPGPGNDASQMASEMMLAATGLGVAAAAVTAADDVASSNKNTPAARAGTTGSSMFVNPKSKGSMFVGGGVSANNKASRVTPLVPQSYGDKKAAARRAPLTSRMRDDIAARARITGISLTGASLTGAKPSPIRGASVKESDARAIKVAEIIAELSVTNRVMSNPYENTKRLAQDYKRGVDTAENTVLRTPERLKNAVPKAAAQMHPAPPKGSN